MSVTEYYHKPEEESTREKHVPHLEIIEEGLVKVSCGKEVMHPSSEKHFIGYIKLIGVTPRGLAREIGTVNLTPALSDPVALFKVHDQSLYQAYIAVSYCNLHGYWENRVDL